MAIMIDETAAQSSSGEIQRIHFEDSYLNSAANTAQDHSTTLFTKKETKRRKSKRGEQKVESEQEDIFKELPRRASITTVDPSPHYGTLDDATTVARIRSSVRNKNSLGVHKIESVVQQHKLETPSRTLSLPVQNMNPARLFIASLGNPPPYSATRHSAGHTMIKNIQSYLQFPTFQKSRTYANGLTSVGADIGRPEFILWQSPSLMNVSGVALLKAYKAFMLAAQVSPTDPLPGLIILYDEMETSPSQLRLRRGATSAKGHNGLKSVQQQLQSGGLLNKLGDRYVKIGIGIGRPAGGSRSSEDVSQYVLGQFTSGERQALDAKVGDLVNMLETEAARMSS